MSSDPNNRTQEQIDAFQAAFTAAWNEAQAKAPNPSEGNLYAHDSHSSNPLLNEAIESLSQSQNLTGTDNS